MNFVVVVVVVVYFRRYWGCWYALEVIGAFGLLWIYGWGYWHYDWNQCCAVFLVVSERVHFVQIFTGCIVSYCCGLVWFLHLGWGCMGVCLGWFAAIRAYSVIRWFSGLHWCRDLVRNHATINLGFMDGMHDHITGVVKELWKVASQIASPGIVILGFLIICGIVWCWCLGDIRSLLLCVVEWVCGFRVCPLSILRSEPIHKLIFGIIYAVDSIIAIIVVIIRTWYFSIIVACFIVFSWLYFLVIVKGLFDVPQVSAINFVIYCFIKSFTFTFSIGDGTCILTCVARGFSCFCGTV